MLVDVLLYLFEFPSAHESPWVGHVEFLGKAFFDHGSGRLCQEFKFVEVLDEFFLILVRRYEPYQNGAFIINVFYFNHIICL